MPYFSASNVIARPLVPNFGYNTFTEYVDHGLFILPANRAVFTVWLTWVITSQWSARLASCHYSMHLTTGIKEQRRPIPHRTLCSILYSLFNFMCSRVTWSPHCKECNAVLIYTALPIVTWSPHCKECNAVLIYYIANSLLHCNALLIYHIPIVYYITMHC